MSIRISNGQTSALVRSYALAELDEQGLTVVWLEIAPQHPKVLGAIWASLVTNSAGRTGLRLTDDEQGHTHTVFGLKRRYETKAVPVPSAAGRARPKFLRAVAPELLRLDPFFATRPVPFCAVEWHWQDADGQGRVLDAATALAAMLERGTQWPIRISWGPYLLEQALARQLAQPLCTGGSAPQGYLIRPAPWDEIIAEGVRTGQISLEEAGQTAPSLIRLISKVQALEPVAA
jgi:hypothetical protein